MRAWAAHSGAELARLGADRILGELAAQQQRAGFSGSVLQDVAWDAQLPALIAAVQGSGGEGWTVALEYELTRLERRIDAVILTDRAIVCCEFKLQPPAPEMLRDVEDYALRLRDFHAGSRDHPVVPLLVAGAGGFRPPAQHHLDLPGVQPVLVTGTAGLADALRWIQARFAAPATQLDGRAWLHAAYAPVPGIIEAARRMYERHDVVELGLARAETGNLTRTAEAIGRALSAARERQERVVVFVTGIPGAGKTLCGLNTVFQGGRAAFLTGNSPLVAVLRAALLRDATRHGRGARPVGEEVEGFIQDVHRFLNHHVRSPAPPPEDVIVFDEAQRAWDQAKATRPTQNRKPVLTMSEPAHALEIMARRPDWSAIVALIGNGQEINTGEAGLAEWGRAIAAHGGWRAVAARCAAEARDPLQRLAGADVPWLTLDDDLDLTVPVRAIRNGAVAGWVAAILDNDAAQAAALAAQGELPVFLTRDLAAARDALRRMARGHRRAGLVRSAGGKRLRAEGLGAEVTAKEVADWFLERFPDIRASDALEAAATEYACQGLELDVVGLAWDLDFRREGGDWRAWQLSGGRWRRETSEFDYVRNTYRVLLTRARYETVIWVPRGSRRDEPWYDRTRDADMLDAIADFLLACGARPLEAAPPEDAAPARLL